MTFFLKEFQSFEIRNPKVGALRVISVVADLASKFVCSNRFSFRIMQFLVIFQKLDLKKFKLGILKDFVEVISGSIYLDSLYLFFVSKFEAVDRLVG